MRAVSSITILVLLGALSGCSNSNSDSSYTNGESSSGVAYSVDLSGFDRDSKLQTTEVPSRTTVGFSVEVNQFPLKESELIEILDKIAEPHKNGYDIINASVTYDRSERPNQAYGYWAWEADSSAEPQWLSDSILQKFSNPESCQLPPKEYFETNDFYESALEKQDTMEYGTVHTDNAMFETTKKFDIPSREVDFRQQEVSAWATC